MAGLFSGDPQTTWLTEPGVDRRMRLLADFWFDDPVGHRWFAPKGSVVDGASIPQALWSSVGSPYTGPYRRASIVHDVACNTNGVPRDAADEMFYFACIAGGCSVIQAKLLYAGVRIGSWAASRDILYEVTDESIAVGRLPSQHTPEELELRARFTLISKDLRETGDDFASVKKVVDIHLDTRRDR